ncbi:MAG TPA: hypothetical protein VJT50_10035 [Pyrinomonadaceae bacterium]|nr:hypothetical protein [Pyrinomonadaceae bacterium]
MRSVPPAVAGGPLINELMVGDWIAFSLVRNARLQLTISNLMAHPLPLGGTDLPSHVALTTPRGLVTNQFPLANNPFSFPPN